METGPSFRGPFQGQNGGVDRSEWQVVVLVLESSRELLEIIRSRGSSRSAGLGLRARRTRRPALTHVPTARRAEHDELAHVDLGRILGLAVLVLPLTILDTAFDEELVALLHVLLDDVGELRILAVPD